MALNIPRPAVIRPCHHETVASLLLTSPPAPRFWFSSVPDARPEQDSAQDSSHEGRPRRREGQEPPGDQQGERPARLSRGAGRRPNLLCVSPPSLSTRVKKGKLCVCGYRWDCQCACVGGQYVTAPNPVVCSWADIVPLCVAVRGFVLLRKRADLLGPSPSIAHAARRGYRLLSCFFF